jgi:hypothetical protein
MVVGIALDGVVRDFIGKFEEVYDKYYPQELEEGEELPEREITSLDLEEHFHFSGGTEELNKFLYFDASLEIFGHANELKLNAVEYLNQAHNILEDAGHTPIIISKELNNSKPSTFFFLSKLSCKANKIQFVRNGTSNWDHVDVLITADPESLKTKTNGKISVKVINKYNSDVDSDYTIVDLKELIDDNSLLTKILNTSTINFTEIED